MMSDVFSDKKQLILCWLGIAGGLAAFVAISITNDVFGYPGSAEYETYERFNRLMAVFLLLQVCSLIAFSRQYGSRLGRTGRIAFGAAIAGWLGMAIATAAEFWLYSDLSYSEQNMRQIAFSLFSLSSLLVGIALLVLGAAVYRNRALPRIIAIIIMAYLFVEVVFFFIGGSIFLAAAVYAILFSVAALPVFKRPVYLQEHQDPIQ